MYRSITRALIGASLCAITPFASARIAGKSERANVLSPEEQLATFKVPEGFKVELIASEENGLINPIDIAFDDAGRLWTQTAEMYPMDAVDKIGWYELLALLKEDPKEVEKQFPDFKRIRDLYQLNTRGIDKVLIIEDPTKQVEGQIPAFAEGLAIPQSILPYKNGAFVAHGSEMLFLEDTDGDGKADAHKSVLSGFGFNDSHTMAHTLVRGPGGWVHFSHGALNAGEIVANESGNSTNITWSKIARFSLDGKEIEVQNCGLQNIWGFDMKSSGRWFGTEANDMGYSLVNMDPMVSYRGLGGETIRNYQTLAPAPHDFLIGGTGISGLAYDENGSKGFPAQWNNVGFLANPITNSIDCVISDRNPDGTVVSEMLEDFLTCGDEWFRPVNIEFGPDGALYIVDWYNKIISHNEIPREHPDRDKSHGRIWRVSHVSQEGRQIPNILAANSSELPSYLQSEMKWERKAAWQQIADRQAVELVPVLEGLLADTSLTNATRTAALWSLESLGHYNQALLQQVIGGQDADLVREAIRSLATFQPGVEAVVALVSSVAEHPHHMVKEQVLRTLEEIGETNADAVAILVSACKPEVKANAYGGGYEQNFQRFLARKALELYPAELAEFLYSAEAKEYPAANLDWASQALGPEQRYKLFAENWEARGKKLDAETLISISVFIDLPEVLELIAPELVKREFIELALSVQPQIISSKFHAALTPGLKALMATGDANDLRLALKAVQAFETPSIHEEIFAYASSLEHKQVSAQLIDLLALNRKVTHPLLEQIAADTSVSEANRLRAAMGVTHLNGVNPMKLVIDVVQGKSVEEMGAAVEALSLSSNGCAILAILVEGKQIPVEAFSYDAAKRLTWTHPSKSFVQPLNAHAWRLQQAKTKEANEKVESYYQAFKTKEGNATVGQGIFTACLACHQVNGQGQNLAPSLDGSANRDVHHLLTAIVNPDAAAEAGYLIQRVIKTSGEMVEGYLVSKNEYGTTIAFMGGAQTFIPAELTKTQVRVARRSFMPSHFGSLPEQTMVDLLNYIQTIK